MLRLIGAATGIFLALTAACRAEAVEIRLGAGEGSSEQLYLMQARPDLTPNQGKLYTYTMPSFRGPERVTAFIAGQLDAVAISTTNVIFTASKGIPITAVATIGRDSVDGYSTTYLALADSDVSVKSLKDRTIGINGFRQAFELYARIAVKEAGLDPDRDVKWVIIPLPQMGDALRARKIDIGIFTPFFLIDEEKRGGTKRVFTAVGVSGIAEEFNVAFQPSFLEKHPAAVRAWASDLVNVTKYYRDHPNEARKALLDAKLVSIVPEVYLNMTAKDDFVRPADCKPDAAMFAKLQAKMLSMGYTEKAVEVGKIVDASFLP